MKHSRDDLKVIAEDLVAELIPELCDQYDGLADFMPGFELLMHPGGKPGTLGSMEPKLNADGTLKQSGTDPVNIGEPGTGVWKVTIYYNNFPGEVKSVAAANGQFEWTEVSIPCSSLEHVRSAFLPTIYHELLHRCMSHSWRYGWGGDLAACDHYMIDRLVVTFLCKKVAQLIIEIQEHPPEWGGRAERIARIKVLCKSYTAIEDEWTSGVNGANAELRRIAALKCLCRQSTRARWDDIENGVSTPFCDCGLGQPGVMPPRPGNGMGEFDPSFCGYVNGDPNDPNPGVAWPPNVEIIPFCDCTVPAF